MQDLYSAKFGRDSLLKRLVNCKSADLGPVVQSIVSLTKSLRRYFVKYMPTTLSKPVLFFIGRNVRI